MNILKPSYFTPYLNDLSDAQNQHPLNNNQIRPDVYFEDAFNQNQIDHLHYCLIRNWIDFVCFFLTESTLYCLI